MIAMSALALSSGAQLSYGETGAGTTIIMVHGSPGEGRAWANVIKHLPGNLRVLTPDLPGYGNSDPLPPEITSRTEAMASTIGELALCQNGLVWLCGHSYGANVALHTAAQFRFKVSGVILLEPVFLRALQLVGESELFKEAQTLFASYLHLVEASKTDAIGIMIDYWCGEGYYDQLPPRTKAFLNAAAVKNALDVRASFAETIGTVNLAYLDRPTVIAFGDRSPKITETIAASCQRLLPQALTRRIDGATHLLLDTHAAEVAELVEATIKRHMQ